MHMESANALVKRAQKYIYICRISDLENLVCKTLITMQTVPFKSFDDQRLFTKVSAIAIDDNWVEYV